MTLSERDQRVIWHPFTQHALGASPLPVVGASGTTLELEGGRRIVDGISSWWVNLHGHSHPRIVRAIAEQCAKMEHVIFAGFTHEPAVRLAESLLDSAKRSGGNFARAFYSDNGSTAVEVALKMAYQFHLNRGDRKRSRFLALRGAYHGDTFGAMAVGEPCGFHGKFKSLLPDVDFIEPGDWSELDRLLGGREVPYAAFIFEPLIQAAGGMRIYHPEFLKAAMDLCEKKGVLTIADEVFTGFYRTGTCFAFEQVGISPDLLCLSKGITGGFLPLAVTLTSEDIYGAFLSCDKSAAFLHGHSYTANPIACAAALESWRMLSEEDCQARIRRIATQTSERIARLQRLPQARNARSLGTIGAIEVESSDITERSIAKGVLLRPLGNVIYAVPPYSVTLEELDRIYDVMEEIVDEG